MLRLSLTPPGKEAGDIVKKFINDRLIGLMEGIILDEIDWNHAMEGKLEVDEDGNAAGNESIDVDALMDDMDFAENVALLYLPDNYPVAKANYEFFGLYKLLKAKEEYKPPLPMEYILYHIIYGEVAQIDDVEEMVGEGVFDELADDPFFEGIEDEEYSTVERIPEPGRSIVLAALEKELEEDYTAEDMITLYEDLREYGECCFEDFDCLLLDKMTEEELVESPLAAIMAIDAREDQKTMEFGIGDKKVTMNINVAPWDKK